MLFTEYNLYPLLVIIGIRESIILLVIEKERLEVELEVKHVLLKSNSVAHYVLTIFCLNSYGIRNQRKLY